MCISHFPVLVIDASTESKLGEKELILSYSSREERLSWPGRDNNGTGRPVWQSYTEGKTKQNKKIENGAKF